jgi:hypothetical protein
MNESGDRPPYWFRAKRYGYGWGLPVRWQGWAVLAGYGAAMTGAGLAGEWLAPPLGPVLTVTLMLVSTIAFVVVCRRTGERPEWRWGDDRGKRPGC